MKDLVKELRNNGIKGEIKQKVAINILATIYENFQHYVIVALGDDPNATIENTAMPECYKVLAKKYFKENDEIQVIINHPIMLLNFYKKVVEMLYNDFIKENKNSSDLALFLPKTTKEIVINSLVNVKTGENEEDVINTITFDSLGATK